jgi:hypothetical protein
MRNLWSVIALASALFLAGSSASAFPIAPAPDRSADATDAPDATDATNATTRKGHVTLLGKTICIGDDVPAPLLCDVRLAASPPPKRSGEALLTAWIEELGRRLASAPRAAASR